jgi:regulator of protease activity HflC (stomatin/prohibitin superfamily)
MGHIIGSIVGLIVAIILAFSMIKTVPTGYTGILTTFGKVEPNTVSAGVHVIAPWQKIVKLDNRTQKVSVETDTFSKDIQQVKVSLAVNFCIDQATAQELYKTVGVNYYESVVLPRILENVKAVVAEYSAENLVAKRGELSDEILTRLTDDAAAYGINIISISVEDIDFTDEFTDAVERKQVASQNKLAAETEQAQKTMEEQAAADRAIISAKAKAEQDVIAANAELEVTKIQAEAALYAGEKEAEMNKRIAESLTPNLVKYYYIKQWEGVLPKTVLGEDNSFMISLE